MNYKIVYQKVFIPFFDILKMREKIFENPRTFCYCLYFSVQREDAVLKSWNQFQFREMSKVKN